MCEMDMGHFTNPNLSMAVVRCWYSGCVVLDRTSTCSICIATLTYVDDRIYYDCLLIEMAALQAADVRTSFLFVGDLNGQQQEWLGSTTTNSHGVADLDFVTVSGCDQLVTGQTHARGGTLDLLMTDVPDLVRVAVVARLGSSDQSSLSIAISMAQAIPNFSVSKRVLLKHRVNLTAICDAIGMLPWRSIWSADNPVERLNVHFSLLVERFVPTKVIRVCNKDKPWFNNDCRRSFDLNQEAHLRCTHDRSRVNWEEFVHYQRIANAVYAEAMGQFSVRSKDVLMNAQCPHKWWSTLKSTVLGSSSDSSLPPVIGAGGGLVCRTVGKAEMLCVDFEGKQTRDLIDLPSTCHPSPSLSIFAFRSRESCWIWISMVVLTHWMWFLIFWRGQLRFWPLIPLTGIRNQFSITSGQGWLRPMLFTGKWGKKIFSYGGVFDLAVEQPQLFRKL